MNNEYKGADLSADAIQKYIVDHNLQDEKVNFAFIHYIRTRIMYESLQKFWEDNK